MMGLLFKALILKTYGGKSICPHRTTCKDFGTEYFCFSVSPEKQKLFSVSSVPPW
jgi:hypothetical protein